MYVGKGRLKDCGRNYVIVYVAGDESLVWGFGSVKKRMGFREILGRCDRRLWTLEMSEDDLVNLAKLYFK